jgi:hypothetical protein
MANQNVDFEFLISRLNEAIAQHTVFMLELRENLMLAEHIRESMKEELGCTKLDLEK